MKRIKIVMLAGLAFTFLNASKCGPSTAQSESAVNKIDKPVYFPEAGASVVFADCFEYAESVTGFPGEILRGIAATESHFRAGVVGDSGMSYGMFQLHSRWHESRVKKWGEFDPADPFESAVIAARIMRENLSALNGDLTMAIAAYRQGVSGVQKWGISQWYVEAVLNWREDIHKVASYTQLISDSEGYYKTVAYLTIGG